MRQLITGLLLLWFSPIALAQLPIPVGTEVVIETNTKSVRGTLTSSSNDKWVSIIESESKANTLIPVGAIEVVRRVDAEETAVEPTVDAAQHVDKQPLDINVRVTRDETPKAVISIKANQNVGPTFLEVVFLGVADIESIEGFVKSSPRKKMLLRLPANAAFARQLKEFQLGEERKLEFSFSLGAEGRGGVIATIGTDLPAQGEPGLIGPLAVLESSYIVFTASKTEFESGSTFLDVQVKQLRRQKDARTFLEPGESMEEAIKRLKRSGAGSIKSVTPPPDEETAEAENREDETSVIKVHGTVRFTDVSGGQHPIPFVRVEVWDANIGSDEMLVAGTTDVQGRYSLSVAGNADDQPDIYVIVRASGTTVQVQEFVGGDVWAMDSMPAINDVPSGSDTQIDVTASNDEINHPSNVAFEVFSAVEVMARYMSSLGLAAPRKVRVEYPRAGDGSDYQNDIIRLGGSDAHDWDNIQHEYGHHLQAVFGISDSPGGPHGLNENLCVSRGKRNGIRLAWGEGWPTFFSILMQTERNLSTLSIPHLGDTRYTDTKPAGFDLEYDIENDFGVGGAGEGNEIAVQRVLWDLYDSSSGEQEQIAIAPGVLFRLADDTNTVTFSQFWSELVDGSSASDVAALGDLLTAHDIAANPESPGEAASYTGGTVPTFTWSGSAGCNQSGQAKYRIIFYDNDISTQRFVSGPLTSLSFTPTASERDLIFGGSNGPINWAVQLRDETTPQTGQYIGSSRMIIDAFNPPVAEAVLSTEPVVVSVDATSKVEAQLTKLEKAWAKAVETNDPRRIEKFFTDRFLFIGAGGVLQDRKSHLEDFSSGKLKIDSVRLADMAIEVYARNQAAVVSTTVEIEGKFGDRDIAGTYQFTDVWVSTGGGWAAAVRQQAPRR